jgi:hypothetical protein
MRAPLVAADCRDDRRDRGPSAVRALARVGPAGPVLGVGHADPAGECAQAGQGAARAAPEQVFGHAVDGRAVADFGGGGALGREQGGVAGSGFAPLVVGASDIDPVAALALGCGDVVRA